ncbi:hypothetical protein L1887_32048 [Cichorium endivia]|nr:hypothetical protein L1887_32048 [Cichorium endivia]
MLTFSTIALSPPAKNSIRIFFISANVESVRRMHAPVKQMEPKCRSSMSHGHPWSTPAISSSMPPVQLTMTCHPRLTLHFLITPDNFSLTPISLHLDTF